MSDLLPSVMQGMARPPKFQPELKPRRLKGSKRERTVHVRPVTPKALHVRASSKERRLRSEAWCPRTKFADKASR